MKTAIIIHGMPSKKEYFNPRSPAESNKHWLPWIQQQLISKEILAQAPEFPEPYKPVYEKWRQTFEQFKIDKNTILIGHSLGAGFLVRWLSENKIKVSRIVLVAPWIDPGHTLKTNFFNFKIDKNLAKKTGGLAIIYSNNDSRDVKKSVNQLKNELGGDGKIKELENRGHFTFKDMKTEKFPELRDAIFKKFRG